MTPDLAPTLKLLGGAVIQVGDTPLGGPAAHRHRLALLALLATSGRVMSRDKLVAYLWPERDTESARNLLKTAVHELRKVLGESAIRSTGDQLSVDAAMLRCDVTEFEAAVTAGDLSKAAALYAGPFLDGFFLKDASEFEHWVDAQRVRLEELHERVKGQLANAGLGTRHSALGSVALGSVAPSVPSARSLGGWRAGATASVVLLGVVAVLLVSARGRSRAGASGAVAPSVAPVILPDDQLGTALAFNGTTANVSTRAGTVVTTQVDNIVVDMILRYDGRTSYEYQMIWYNGHGGVTGWGLMVVGQENAQQDGTIGVIAGGISVVATTLVLKAGTWQHLSAERKDGKVLVTLDDKSYSVGAFPVNPLAGRYRDIERTTVGGDGTFDEPMGHFRGAIDRLRIRDLQSGYFMHRWNFDEGKGATTVSAQGAVLFVGSATWTPAARRTPQEVFWARLEAMCFQSWPGRLTEGSAADSALRAPLILHLRHCQPNELRFALHVGTDRSRTWVLSRASGGLHLRHARHHADGTVDAITNYGGTARVSGSFSQQEFPADARSASLLPGARGGAWTLEIAPAERFVYALRGTPGALRLEFDLRRTVAQPPPPWGTRP